MPADTNQRLTLQTANMQLSVLLGALTSALLLTPLNARFISLKLTDIALVVASCAVKFESRTTSFGTERLTLS